MAFGINNFGEGFFGWRVKAAQPFTIWTLFLHKFHAISAYLNCARLVVFSH